MKFSKIALATSMALAAMTANAIGSAGIPDNPDNILFISGASGVDSYLGATADYFINVTTYIHSADNNYKAWYGTTKTDIGTLGAGANLLIIKRSAGGSAYGVGPLARGTLIDVPDWRDATPTAVDTTLTALSIAATSNQWTVATRASALAPDIGVSDVEPKMFTGINAEAGISVLTNAEQALLTPAPWAVLAEGIAVNNRVPETANITNTWVREALDGHDGYKNWSKVDGSTTPVTICRRIEGSGTQAAYNSYFNGFPGTSFYNGYGRNVPKVTSNSLGYNATGTNTGLSTSAPILISPSAGFTVFEGYASTDVRKCLQAAQLGIDVTLQGRSGTVSGVTSNRYYKLKFGTAPVTGGAKAIGVLSLDSYTSTSATRAQSAAVTTADGKGYAKSTGDWNGEWTFRNLNGKGTYDVANQVATCAAGTDGTNDLGSTVPFVSGCSGATGVAPSRVNILTGAYDFVVEPTLQILGSNTSWKLDFFNSLSAVLASPASMMPGSANNAAPYAYAAVPSLVTKVGTYDPANPASAAVVVDLTHQGNTTSPLHVKQ